MHWAATTHIACLYAYEWSKQPKIWVSGVRHTHHTHLTIPAVFQMYLYPHFGDFISVISNLMLIALCVCVFAKFTPFPVSYFIIVSCFGLVMVQPPLAYTTLLCAISICHNGRHTHQDITNDKHALFAYAYVGRAFVCVWEASHVLLPTSANPWRSHLIWTISYVVWLLLNENTVNCAILLRLLCHIVWLCNAHTAHMLNCTVSFIYIS